MSHSESRYSVPLGRLGSRVWFKLFVFLCALITPLCCAASQRNVNRQQLRTIESYMDVAADPCVDFFQYACGNWKNVHADADYAETIGLVDSKANHEFSAILKLAKRSTQYWNYKFVRAVVDYFRSCRSLEEYDPVQYLEWLSQHEHFDWLARKPTRHRGTADRSSNASTNWDWLRLLATLRKYGLNGIFVEETVIQDRENSRRSRVDIDKPVLNGFTRMNYMGFALLLDYIGTPASGKTRANLWDKVQIFEVKLESLDDMEDDSGVQKVMLAELNMPWLERYLSIVLGSDVDPSMEITIQNLPYLNAVIDLLNNYEPEFICRYLVIRFLWALNVEGPRDFVPKDCVAHTRSMMPMAMSWLYETFNPDLLQDTPHIEAIFDKLVQYFNSTLFANANKFDPDVVAFLRAKVEGMQIKVGNLPRPQTAEKLEAFYKNLSINASDYYANHLRVLAFNTQIMHLRLRYQLPESRDEFYYLEDAETGSCSSPYYLLRSNMIIVPLTLLHMPIYHTHLHDIFKHSLLGFLLAHEIAHAFDDSGVEFDPQGNMRGPADDIKSNAHFEANLICLREKNPQIIDEKIADISGLRWAYESYFAGNTSDKDMAPRSAMFSKYSTRHIFFLNFAQFFCGNRDDESDANSEHGPDRERIFHTLSNFAEFARDYECQPESPMHPKRKCQLWR